MKKRLLLIVLTIVFLLLAVIGVREIIRYNQVDYRFMYTGSENGDVYFPAFVYGEVSQFGMSKKARKKAESIYEEFHNKVDSFREEILLSYKTYTVQSTIRTIDGKTEFHVFGEGIKNDDTESTEFDYLATLNYEFPIYNEYLSEHGISIPK